MELSSKGTVIWNLIWKIFFFKQFYSVHFDQSCIVSWICFEEMNLVYCISFYRSLQNYTVYCQLKTFFLTALIFSYLLKNIKTELSKYNFQVYKSTFYLKVSLFLKHKVPFTDIFCLIQNVFGKTCHCTKTVYKTNKS